ncbi:hypothetical protein A2348_01040 [Candidatus Uhrbacteria bacterium RIFOXYB12_FULL_58_10]|uniref:Glycosyl transferase family 1 domain-containing protein n=1 Tax=Candidatus Uhrbacteria bacterium RIFOXYB2_FULL_57_15 TaxID=1802422 RepID=A0A1F7W877_9BACT|nr:MAG: hypothetical protein A2348_01040 [Candidatus Uhrbacteria bacterium RIFOXYB12_FULL_58_10]OGL99005.1 MAG: hypothetical protein A2304_02550 [Candidatus Uhrbacteria bacterium RIFOXYB2_FULL_57_15]OGM00226.1 MAG: hypothetical protein A2501_01685 [Candidatus Uhrbacteria bacterium RIFOXYC12_FULL_57_11]
MKIAIDGTTLRARDGSPGAGIEQYTRMISSALVAAAPDLIFVALPIGRLPIFSRHLSVALRAYLFGADILFCPSGQIPLGWLGRSVIVVHDLAVYEHPEWFPHKGFQHKMLDNAVRSIRRADAIIAVSEATRDQIARLFPGVASKVRVVYPAVDVCQMAQTSRHETVLFVGTIEPRKNLVNAVAAFDTFLRMHPERSATARFALAGKVGWKSEEILEAIFQTNDAWRKKAGEDVVRLLGYVTEGEKQSLYAQAVCLFFPSWYEGFGLPALEAMAAGLPVIASNRGALPEVCGDAAMYVEPDDVEQMALALAQCVMLPDAMREMTAQAKNRADQFTWERAASEILDVITTLSASTR